MGPCLSIGDTVIMAADGCKYKLGQGLSDEEIERHQSSPGKGRKSEPGKTKMC